LKILAYLLFISCMLAACAGVPGTSLPTPEPSETGLPFPPPTPSPTSAPTSTTPPTATAAPTPVDETLLLRQALLEALDSVDWTVSEIPETQLKTWRAFAEGRADLPKEDLKTIESLVSQWGQYSAMMEDDPIPSDAQVGFRAHTMEDDQGKKHLVLYAVDISPASEEGSERLFLTGYDTQGLPQRLVRAPIFEGLAQRISQDGKFVEYVDENGEWIFKADAMANDFEDYIELEIVNALFYKYHIYPRYYFNIPNVAAGFYGLESLSYNQIQLLKSTLELFNREELSSFVSEVFPAGETISFLVSRQPDETAAAMAVGTFGNPPSGLVILYSRNLFDNSYNTAAAIAHEAAHIWQGRGGQCRANSFSIEVGDQSIPAGFYDWTGDELKPAIQEMKIGAYHVGLWVLQQFGQTRFVQIEERWIQTGIANGRDINPCK
jgi:hypothetical protein